MKKLSLFLALSLLTLIGTSTVVKANPDGDIVDMSGDQEHETPVENVLEEEEASAQEDAEKAAAAAAEEEAPAE